MELGLIILAVIIVLDLIAMYFVMNIGSKHDSHTEIRSAESSRAVQTLLAQDEKARARRAEAEAKAAEHPEDDNEEAPEKLTKQASVATTRE